MSYESEETLRKLRDGEISEYEAQHRLERDYGSCSCMRGSIDDAIRNVEHYGRDSWSARRDLDDAHDRCERDEKDRRDEEEREEQRQYERREDARRQRQIEEEEVYMQIEQQYPQPEQSSDLPF